LRQFLFAFLSILISCSSSKIETASDFNISVVKAECGSYAVKNQSDTIGYIVKPLNFYSATSTDNITRFEKLLKSQYGDSYDTFKRQYWFTATRGNDTLIFVTMFSRREMGLVKDWKCEEQEVDVYNKIFRNVETKKFPRTFSFNCTKDRWTLLGED
jgi:hypothetical protein